MFTSTETEEIPRQMRPNTAHLPLRWPRSPIEHYLMPLALVLVWWALSVVLGPVYVASPTATVAALADGVESGWLIEHGQATGIALLYGYLLAVGIGVVGGVLVGASRFAFDVLQPLIYAMYTLPKVALFPIFLFIFGIGTSAKAWFAMSFGVFPILIFTITGVREVRPVLIKLAKTLRLGQLEKFRKITFPATLPSIVTGLRLGFGVTFLGVVISEMFASQSGLGTLLIQSVSLRQTPRLYGLVLLLTLFAFVVNGLFLLWQRTVKHD